MKPILDLSYYDGREIRADGSYVYHPLTWLSAKTKWAGAIVKASQGVTIDPLYTVQTTAMRMAAVPFGSYHFFDSAVNAIAAANNTCDLLERSGGYGQLGLWLDVETNLHGLTGTTYLNYMASWLNEAKKRMTAAGCSYPLGIYTRASFIDPLWINAGKPAWIMAFPAWLAMYSYDRATDFDAKYAAIMAGTLKPPPPASQALPKLVCHQWTARGKAADVPGYPPYKKAIDFNFWMGEIPGVITPPPPVTLEDRVKALEAWRDKVAPIIGIPV